MFREHRLERALCQREGVATTERRAPLPFPLLHCTSCATAGPIVISAMKLCIFLLFVGTTIIVRAAEPSPATPKKPVFNEYQGVKVEDDYQWLEKNDDP